MAASCHATAGRVTPDHQRAAVLCKISRILSFFGNFPDTGKTYAVGMEQPAETLAIVTPAQIGAGIDSPFHRLPKEIWQAQRQDTAQDAQQGDLVDRPRRFAGTTPHFLVRVGEHSVA